MSWLPSFSSSSTSKATKPIPSGDGAFVAPDRTSRKACWEARDAFFNCLNAHRIIDSIKEADQTAKVCGDSEALLRRDCASSWVTYFKQRRVMEEKKKAMLEGLRKEGAVEVQGGQLPGGLPRPGGT